MGDRVDFGFFDLFLGISKFNRKAGTEFFPSSKFREVFDSLDFSGNGKIEYTEFQMLFCYKDLLDDKKLQEEFNKFDLVSKQYPTY